MIRFFNRYYKSVVGLFLVVVISFSMLFFGVNIGGKGHEEYAIKIDNHLVFYEDIRQKKKELMNRYSAMFGDQLKEILPLIEKDIDEKIEDMVLREELLAMQAKQLGFMVSPEVILKLIVSQFKDFSPQAYKSFLLREGITATEFENRLRTVVLFSYFHVIYGDFLYPLKEQIYKKAKLNLSKYKVVRIILDVKKLLNKVSIPSDEELEKYFMDNVVKYQLSPRISFNYIEFDIREFKDDVQVSDEDIEIYYVEHQKDYRIPPEAEVYEIKIAYNDLNKKERREIAQEVLKKALSGQDFFDLVISYSDDVLAKSSGGYRGKVRKGMVSKSYEKAIFSFSKEGVIPQVIDDGSAFYIVKVKNYRKGLVKPLEEVRGDIVERLKERDAEVYAYEKVMDLYDQWKSSGKSLKDFIISSGIKKDIKSEKGVEVDSLSSSLVKNIFKSLKKEQLVEGKDRFYLVEVEDRWGEDIPKFEDVRSLVLEDYKEEMAHKLANKVLDELKQIVMYDSNLDSFLREVSKRGVFQVKEEELSFSQLREEVQGGFIFREGEVVASFFPLSVDKYFFIGVKEVKEPSMEEVEKNLINFKDRAYIDSVSLALDSLVEILKAHREIDIRI